VKRLDTIRGPIYIAGSVKGPVVIYVHGYRDTAASAIEKHRLPEQFAAAGAEATFVVPEAPSSSSQAISFPDLGELLALAQRPDAKAVVALGHSGAYRTLRGWLKDPRLRHVVLLDALYGHGDEFAAWGRAKGHQLDIVGKDTALLSRQVAEAARVPYYQGGSHMGIVEREGWIARFLAGSSVLLPLGGFSLLAIAAIGFGGYLIYKALQ